MSGTAQSEVVAFIPSALSILAKGSGTIAKPSQVDKTTFSAKAGDVVYLDAQGSCINGLNWRLMAPSGSLLSLGHACIDLGRIVLPDAGTYTVEAYADTDTATGAYDFEVIGAPAERVSSVTLGQTISDRTTWIGEWHDYTFSAKAGDVVFLGAQGTCVNGLLWRLTAPSGSGLSIASACVDLGRVVLPDAGTYKIEIYSDGTAAGPYAFQLRTNQ